MKQTKLFFQTCIVVLALLGASLQLTAQTSVPYTVEQSISAYHVKKAVALPGGKSAVITQNESNRFTCTMVSSSGAALSSFDFTDYISFPNSFDQTELNAIGTAEGNILVTYTSSVAAGMSSNVARFLLLDPTGMLVSGGAVNETNPGASPNRGMELAALSNGNIAMLWLQSDNMSGAVRIFQSNGTPVTGDIVFAGPGSAVFNSNQLFTGNKMAANQNGGFLISFFYQTGNFRAIRFDNAGNVQSTGGTTAFVVDPTPYAGNYANDEALGLSNGNYLLRWKVGSQGYYKVITADGNDVKTKTLLHPDLNEVVTQNGWIACVAANPTATPGFAMAAFLWQDYEDISNPYGRVVLYHYDLAGNFSGTVDLTGNFVADYNPRPCLYTGNPMGIGIAYNEYKSYGIVDGNYILWEDADVKGALLGFSSANLPVLLASFSAELKPDATVWLGWQTAFEQDNSSFTVQKSADGVHYAMAGRVPATNKTGGAVYTFTDVAPFRGISYYRLIQTDVDGKEKELGIRMVKLAGRTATFRIYPNPVTNGVLTVKQDNPAGARLSYQLVNAAGSVVGSGLISGIQASIDISRLPAGIYFLQLSNGQSQVFEKK